MTDYDIAHQAGICAGTRRPLEPGEPFYAVLFDTPAGFERRDYSTEAWETPPDSSVPSWQARGA